MTRFAVIGTIGVLAVSYALALWGEPQAHWWWCQIVGWC